MNKIITVRAAESTDKFIETGIIEVEHECETLKDAKLRAKYYLSETYMNICETSQRLGYAQVLVNGKCVWDIEA